MLHETQPAVLIIDDMDQSRHLLRSMLEEQGFRVHVTSDGRAGLDLLAASRLPMVAAISNVLSDFTAVEFLGRLTAQPEVARRHAYILMTLSPEVARRKLGDAERMLPILLMENPHDLDRLCRAVSEASGRLERARFALTVH